MDCHVNNSLMISGSMDGTAKLWNSTSGKCVGTLLCGAKVKERHNSSMVNLNGPHPFVQGCIFSRKIIPLNRNVLKKNCIICPGVRGNYETYTHLPSLHLYFLNAFKTLSIYLAIILLWNPPMYPYLFIYLFKENCLGCSWPQAIPPLSTPPNDTCIPHAWGNLVSPLKACTIYEPWMQAYPGVGISEPVVFCSPRPPSLAPLNSWFSMIFRIVHEHLIHLSFQAIWIPFLYYIYC